MGTGWTPDEIRAEARRRQAGGGNPDNAHSDLQTALGMIEGLAEAIGELCGQVYIQQLQGFTEGFREALQEFRSGSFTTPGEKP
jgi:hypothetical protein